MTHTRLTGALAAAVATGALLLPGVANAATKTCDLGHGNFTQEQQNSCNASQSNKPGAVTNQGGNTPPGQQP
jgi:hypothetical protein